MASISAGILGIYDGSLAMGSLSYQQVVHKAKKPMGAHLPIILCRDMLRKKDFWLV